MTLLRSGFAALAVGLLASALVAGAGAGAVAGEAPAEPPAQPPDRHGQEERALNLVGRLIEDSSASRQVTQSPNPEANARHEEARSAYRRALEAQAAGRDEDAQRLGNEAARLMFEAVHLAEPEDVVEAKKRRDFQRRLDSVEALLAAHERVATESAPGQVNGRRRASIIRLLEEALSLYDQGQLHEARDRLDGAYVMARVAIESIRDGTTVVHSLDFATKEEEFGYELRRYETYRQLVQLFAQERAQSEAATKQVEGFVASAAELRRQADKHARQKRYDDAVKSVEGATRELVKALRASGVFIPG
jgi:tetratricopeptide (TPR) repeat protein